MMKMNKWTMALAAAGVVSLSSVAQAQEAVAGAEAEAASGTLTGYVSTSYTMVKDGVAPAGYWNAANELDGYALDVIALNWASAQGGGEYATGYTVELWAGPNADNIDTSGNGNTVEIMEANIDLRVPVGSGLNLKVGYFGTVVGHETYNYTDNAFHSRSFGFQVEPTHHTGILASYQASADIAVQFGVANNSSNNQINDRGASDGTVLLGSITYTLPDTLGPIGGTALKYATVVGAGAANDEKDYHYFEAAIPLPIEGLSYTLAFDAVEKDVGASDSVVGHYLSYGVNDKMTLNLRYEHGNINSGADAAFGATQNLDGLESVTIGLDYKLWENVTSRVEWRMDDADGGVTDQETLAVNIIYSF